MSLSIQDQQRVFLAYQALFRGNNAVLRKPKAIRSLLISKNQTTTPLIKSMGIDKVTTILKGLLERGIFESDLKAKLAFPTLYQTSREQDARHEESEAGAARNEAKALQEIEADNQVPVERDAEEDDNNDDDHDGAVDIPPEELEKDSSPPAESSVKRLPESPTNLHQKKIEVPSLYPMHFPFSVQHALLSQIQRLLEECCFDFTTSNVPSLLTEKQWDCPEAIELNVWTLFLVKKLKKRLLTNAFRQKHGVEVSKQLIAVNELRHAAVHRLRISARGMQMMVSHAIEFAETLADPIRASLLKEVLHEIEAKTKALELNKNFLETKLKAELDEIERLRRELDGRERDAMSAVVTEDQENMSFVGSLLSGSTERLLNGTIEKNQEDMEDAFEDCTETQDETQNTKEASRLKAEVTETSTDMPSSKEQKQAEVSIEAMNGVQRETKSPAGTSGTPDAVEEEQGGGQEDSGERTDNAE